MSDSGPNLHNVSRRKVLGGLGAIGVASAGAGLGTSAFFSDEEQFTNNSITAGTLDLKVDWEEHYSDWSEDEADAADIQMLAPGDPVPDGSVGLPSKNPFIAVPQGDVQAFFDATAVEAFPDHLGNEPYDGSQIEIPDGQECDILHSVDDALNANRRTQGLFAGQRTQPGDPLVNLQDVKPGDFGELTLSFHPCGNDSYVWLKGGNLVDVDGTNTEPEIADDDEPQTGPNGNDPIGPDTPGELADAIQTRVWYDDGDNIFETTSINQPTCVVFILDDSGSMAGQKSTLTRDGANNLVDQLDLADGDNGDISPHEAGVVTFGSTITSSQALTTDEPTLESAIQNADGNGGGTNIAAGIQEADTLMGACPDTKEVNGVTRNVRKIGIVLSDGQQTSGDASTAAGNATEIETFFSIGVQAGPGTAELQQVANAKPGGEFFDVQNVNDITTAFGQIIQALGTEEIIFEGSLTALMNEVNFDPANGEYGIPLDADPSTEFDELNDPPDADTREAYIGSTNSYIGVEWCLPVDHANEIQGDRVSFDLGFYAEQARHNSGAGQPPE